jgi:hypothetical protein
MHRYAHVAGYATMLPDVLIEHLPRIVEQIARALHLIIKGVQLRFGAECNPIK